MKNASSNTATAHVTELPDSVRIPLHSLQADLEYLIGRVIADGSCGPMIVKSMRDRLNLIEAYLNQQRRQAEAEIDRLRATLLNIQALAEHGNPIDNAKLATQCRCALNQQLTKE